MRKFLLLLGVLGILVFGYRSWFDSKEKDVRVEGERTGGVRYSFALVGDSHLNNAGLSEALSKAREIGVNQVFGLGDWTEYGEIEKLRETKEVFERSGLNYEVLPGDHDLANSRDLGLAARANFDAVFGQERKQVKGDGVEFILVDNSDIYSGISDLDWFEIKNAMLRIPDGLRFVLAHKTPYNPDTSHVMGSENEAVAVQAKQFLYQLENARVNELFTGDLHHFARYSSPNEGVKITTIGAVDEEKNFQGPSFVIVKIFEDNTYEVENIQL